jgi:hypothetical protein
MKNIIITILIIALIAGGIVFFTRKEKTDVLVPPVQTAQEVQYKDLVHVNAPLPGAKIGSPLTVTGRARGNWYFEASFPVRLLDANGNEIAIKAAQASGDWMTTEYVPFSVTLTFAQPTTPTGTLILQKDNPSGESQFDDSVSIPVTF